MKIEIKPGIKKWSGSGKIGNENSKKDVKKKQKFKGKEKRKD